MGPGWGMSRSVTSCALGKKTNRRIFLCKQCMVKAHKRGTAHVLAPISHMLLAGTWKAGSGSFDCLGFATASRLIPGPGTLLARGPQPHLPA